MISPEGVVLLSCGSFNPITNMHLRLFEVARDAMNKTKRYHVIRGIISPVHDGYGKKDLVPAIHRCQMAELALQTSDWISCDRWESEQNNWQQTVQVLRHHQTATNELLSARANLSNAKKRKLDLMNEAMNCANVTVKLLCGADLLQSFFVPGLWEEVDIVEIVSKFGLVVVTREGSDPRRLIYDSDILSLYKNNIIIVNEWISNNVSSTSLRTAVRRGESIKYLTNDDVIQYIQRHQLYRPLDNKYFPFNILLHQNNNLQISFNVPYKTKKRDCTEQETAVSPRTREESARKTKGKPAIKTYPRLRQCKSSREINVQRSTRKGKLISHPRSKIRSQATSTSRRN